MSSSRGNRWFGVFTGLALVVGACFGSQWLRGGGAARPRRSDWPLNFAHRGDSANAPENTMESFELGLRGGAEGLESDVHLSRDGELFLMHDEIVDRTTDGSGWISDLTSEEIRNLDAGYRFTPDGSDFPYRGRGVRISTLREVYETFPETFVNLDMKSDLTGIEDRLLREILSCGAEGRTLIASESHVRLLRFRRLARGRVMTSASKLEILIFYLAVRSGLWRYLRPDYVALQVPVRFSGLEVVTPEFVAAAKLLGVRVDVWTINERGEMLRLLDLGVDVIMTDRPSVLAEVLRER